MNAFIKFILLIHHLKHFCPLVDCYPDSASYYLTSGTYQAETVDIFDKQVHKITGIPYADVPLMFHKSVVIKNRSNSTSYEGSKWPGMCVQTLLFNFEMYGNFRLPHEVDTTFDCLHINLYIPYEKERGVEMDLRARNLSVMLFVHGGSNAGGTSSYMDGSALAAFGNVVVATINFRLDILGFFNLAERGEYLSGNYGLWDQLNAIKWLHQNCENIGEFTHVYIYSIIKC